MTNNKSNSKTRAVPNIIPVEIKDPPKHVEEGEKLWSDGEGTGPQGNGAKYKHLSLSLSLSLLYIYILYIEIQKVNYAFKKCQKYP